MSGRSTYLSAIAAACVAVSSVALIPSAAVAKPKAGAAALGQRTLRQGASGPDVKALQRLLKVVGIKVDVDGRFGPGVTEAVQRFQRSVDLDASGDVGPKTVAALRQAAAGGAQISTAGGFDADGSPRSGALGDRIPLRRGMSGKDVKALQGFLKKAGIPKVTVDGEFGDGTEKAVEAFEQKFKLTVDGLVDAGDIDVLRGQAVAGASASAAPPPLQLAPGDRATLGADGLAIAPQSAPDAVKQIIAAGNQIAKTPYVYGGGHGDWIAKGYDCSGSVSFALHGAGLLKQALVSGDFPDWGDPGPGQWVTIYGNAGHVFMVVAGLRFDTSGAKGGSRWQTDMRPTSGYGVSHPTGL